MTPYAWNMVISRRFFAVAIAWPVLIAGSALSLKAGDSAEASLARIEAHTGGRLGVAVIDVGSGRTIQYRANERFPFCSTFKLLAAAAVLARCDRGEESLGHWIRFGREDVLSNSPVTQAHVSQGAMRLSALCVAAVESSDNTAGNLLLKTLAGPPGLTRYVRGLGDSVTRIDRYEPGLNSCIAGDPRDTTSPAAMAADVKNLIWGDALRPASRHLLEDWMASCVTGDHRLRAGIPASWDAADKTGTGDHRTSNDVAVLYPPDGGPIVCAVFLTGSRLDSDGRDRAVADVARAVVAVLDR